MDPSNAVPSAPVYAARLNGLLKTLSNTETAVAEIVTARESLVTALESMIQEHKTALEADISARLQISGRKTETEEKKQQVELAIMRALGPGDGNGPAADGDQVTLAQEPGRPEMEALTPPAMEDFTPPPPDTEPFSPISEISTQQKTGEAGGAASSHAVLVSTNGSNKRRRVDDSGEFPDLDGDDGIDSDVAEMLKGEEAQ